MIFFPNFRKCSSCWGRIGHLQCPCPNRGDHVLQGRNRGHKPCLRPHTHDRIHPLENPSEWVSADRFYDVYNPADLFPLIFLPCNGFPADKYLKTCLQIYPAGIHPNGLIRWSVQTQRINPSEWIPRMRRNDSTHAWNSLYDCVAHIAASTSRRRRDTSSPEDFGADFDSMVSTLHRMEIRSYPREDLSAETVRWTVSADKSSRVYGA